MIMTFDIAKTLMIGITRFIGYIITISLSGYLCARLALAFGDDTPSEHGFLTIDPFVHIDWIGLLCVLCFGFGWGSSVPIDYRNISGPWRSLKQTIVFFARAISHVFMAICAMTILLLFDKSVMNVTHYKMFQKLFFSNVTNIGMHGHGHGDSVVFVFALILYVFILLNVSLSAMYLIIDGWTLFVFRSFEKSPYGIIAGNDFARFLIPIILILLFSDSFFDIVWHVVQFFSMLLIRIVGLA